MDEFDHDSADPRIPPRARPSDPSTSHEAIPSDAIIGRDQREALKILVENHRALAAFEISEAARHDLHRRISELERKGMIEPTGERAYNSETNRMCGTYRPTAYGRLIAKRWEHQ